MQMRISVPFVTENVTKCLCTKCPVQLSSTCVSSKLAKIDETLNEFPLRPENIPGVYCSSGIALCTDIQTEKNCLCGSCVIFPEYNLFNVMPMGHYCKNGSVDHTDGIIKGEIMAIRNTTTNDDIEIDVLLRGSEFLHGINNRVVGEIGHIIQFRTSQIKQALEVGQNITAHVKLTMAFPPGAILYIYDVH